jgi:hypothetical protein
MEGICRKEENSHENGDDEKRHWWENRLLEMDVSLMFLHNYNVN